MESIGLGIVENMFKDVTKGAAKSFWEKRIGKKQFVNMFISAGADVASYERNGSEESEIRGIVFCESNMRALAENIYLLDDFTWESQLKLWLHQHLSESALSDGNKTACERHFLEVIKHKLRSDFPETYERGLMQEIPEHIDAISDRLASIETGLASILEKKGQDWYRKQEDERQNVRQEYKICESYRETFGEKISYDSPEWGIKHIFIERAGTSKEEQKKEIEQLIEEWKKERISFPGWYILPGHICAELARNSYEAGLLQSYEWMDRHIMLEFSYELVWRWEKCFHLYSSYECMQICAIWDNYYEYIKGNSQESADEFSCDMIRKWIYIGMALLRVFRESGEDAKWNGIYKLLCKYKEYDTNGIINLQVERAKLAYHHLDMPALRRELSQCQPRRNQFEQRLQILGLHVECGEAKMVVPQLHQLIADIIQGSAVGEETKEYRLSCLSLQACALQLLSLCEQGIHDFEEEYEQFQQRIDDIIDEIDKQKLLFDWNYWINIVSNELLSWKTKQSNKNEPFELNRESRIFFGGKSYCGDAYALYRVMDCLAMPLQCGHVTLLGEMEQPLIEAILQFDSRLGFFFLARSNRSDTIKNLVDRRYVMSLDEDELDNLLNWLLNAMEENVQEMYSFEPRISGSIVEHMSDNAPELLMRLMSRCPEKYMERALLLFKKLIEDEELPENYPLASLQVAIMKQISEKQKARMLGTMMETSICEHKVMYGGIEGLDVFDFYFCKRDIADNRALCSVKQSVIERLLEPSEENDYEWRVKVTRLRVLNELDLLSDEQRTRYAALLWSHVSEKTNLPLTTKSWVWAYEKLPYIDADKPTISVKNFFLNQRLCDLIDDEDGWRLSMGEIPYLDELIALCMNVQADYWRYDEANYLLDMICEYWTILFEKVEGHVLRCALWDEYRSRAQKMIRGAAAVCENISSPIGEAQKNALIQMIYQMKKIGHGVSTRELELVIRTDQEILKEIRKELCSADEGLTVGALRAAFLYIKTHADTAEAQEMLDAIFELLRYRKMPGLLSAIWILHNLVYENCPIMMGRNGTVLDQYLLELANVIRVDDTNCKLSTKEVLSIRSACAATAYQLYYRKLVPDGEGVTEWKRLLADGEANDVKNQWVSGI